MNARYLKHVPTRIGIDRPLYNDASVLPPLGLHRVLDKAYCGNDSSSSIYGPRPQGHPNASPRCPPKVTHPPTCLRPLRMHLSSTVSIPVCRRSFGLATRSLTEPLSMFQPSSQSLGTAAVQMPGRNRLKLTMDLAAVTALRPPSVQAQLLSNLSTTASRSFIDSPTRAKLSTVGRPWKIVR